MENQRDENRNLGQEYSRKNFIKHYDNFRELERYLKIISVKNNKDKRREKRQLAGLVQ